MGFGEYDGTLNNARPRCEKLEELREVLLEGAFVFLVERGDAVE